ncbi:zinc finger CCCH domain-containing protein 14-like [Rutidosis leptorrhynchoides]|uniref:zinc finger CCCH domain-containing protein 14-like n=1 Tax=Rutidosis leptorrhynchoides TaxID=125765 RepID=UPI003A98F20F
MEKKELGSSTVTDGGNGMDNNLPVNLFVSPIASFHNNNNERDEQLDQFDFSSGELYNPVSYSSSIFPPKFSSQSQLSYSSPSDCSFDDDAFNANTIATESRLSQASFILEYQQLYNSYSMCLASLQDSVKDVDALRQENEALRIANNDLIQSLKIISQATRPVRSSPSPSSNLIRDFNRFGIGSPLSESNASVEKVSSVSPKSVIEPNQFVRQNNERVTMPKSISVRSKDYLKSVSAQAHRPIRQPTPLSHPQRVRLPGEKKAGDGLEFEVYNQGMSKTEVCNKWQETGACPYGDSCHFAHGISELRPVIRHPRYKTEVCRMALAGDICPYGHRCHFRHTLTDEEMLMAVKPR